MDLLTVVALPNRMYQKFSGFSPALLVSLERDSLSRLLCRYGEIGSHLDLGSCIARCTGSSPVIRTRDTK